MQFVRCVKKCRMARQATDDSTVQRMQFACQVTKATDTHSEFITLLFFHDNSGYANMHHCCVIRTLPFLSI